MTEHLPEGIELIQDHFDKPFQVCVNYKGRQYKLPGLYTERKEAIAAGEAELKRLKKSA